MPESFFFINGCNRLRAAGRRANGDGAKKTRSRDRAARAVPAPEANAEIQTNIDVCQISCCLLPVSFMPDFQSFSNTGLMNKI